MSLMIYIDHIKCCLHRGGEERSDCNVLYKSRAQHVLQWPLLSRDPREFICLLCCGFIFVLEKLNNIISGTGLDFLIFCFKN